MTVNWDSCSELSGFRPVLDPLDESGRKNLLIDRIHWSILKECLGGTRTLLDFGCGVGRFASRITRLGIGYVGVDISAGMIKAAQQQHGQSGPRFFHFDGANLDFGNAEFDVVLSIGVFVYVLQTPRCGRALSEIARVLKPGGRALLIEQASLSSQKSSSAPDVLVEGDYVAALSRNFAVRNLGRVRTPRFTGLGQRFFSAQRVPPWVASLALGPVARWERWRLRRSSEAELAKAPYYEFLLEATPLAQQSYEDPTRDRV